MSSFSLDDIRAAADRKYGSTDITVEDTTVRLLNPLRMKKAQRDKLIGVQKEMEAGTDEAEDVDQVAVFQQALRIVAQTPAQAKLLIDAIGDDLGVLAEVFERYTEGQSVGEASSSAA
ncbi:phage tail assembly protein [Lentzea sp. JNUCC 0626]|uniref:phage tail assembly protein n=1 Tax=Lentzea sp. JNUCC 0626 TaxID=3367513 RepID=UPI00374A4C0A